MWVKPWKLAVGFLIGGGLFAVGLVLQLTMGPIDWSLFAAPVNWIMLLLLLGFLVLMFLLRKKVYAFEWMMHGQAAVAAIAWALGITLVMGLLPQTRGGGVPWLPAVYAGIFLMLAGALAQLFTRRYWRWGKNSFVLPECLILATVAFVYFFTPVFRNKALMPALQSPWFVPHVVVYMFSYAILAAATLMAVYLLFSRRHENGLAITDSLVYAGLSFLTVGMLFGALWAKEAWGHYWAWDPKETWAAITWLCYLLYMHFRRINPKEWRKACWILLLAFVCLQICWWGINYLPSAQGLSIHTYNVNF